MILHLSRGIDFTCLITIELLSMLLIKRLRQANPGNFLIPARYPVLWKTSWRKIQSDVRICLHFVFILYPKQIQTTSKRT
jgi:hypothetical protein